MSSVELKQWNLLLPPSCNGCKGLRDLDIAVPTPSQQCLEKSEAFTMAKTVCLKDDHSAEAAVCFLTAQGGQ